MKRLTQKDIRYPKRTAGTHKGESGRVLVVGGSEDLVGAVALAGISALRAGADLVIIAAPERVAWSVNSLYPDLITKKLPGKTLGMRHWRTIRRMADRADVILVGNGMGRSWGARRLVNRLACLPGRKVFDADALRMVRPALLKETIITPHADELSTFLQHLPAVWDARPEVVHERLREWLGQENILILKGPEDYVMSRDRIVRNTTGNPGMAKGGTGDVLAGLCAGFYAQQDAWQAACNAAFVNGRIGDLLKRKHKGYAYLASDMVGEIQRFTA